MCHVIWCSVIVTTEEHMYPILISYTCFTRTSRYCVGFDEIVSTTFEDSEANKVIRRQQ